MVELRTYQGPLFVSRCPHLQEGTSSDVHGWELLTVEPTSSDRTLLTAAPITRLLQSCCDHNVYIWLSVSPGAPWLEVKSLDIHSPHFTKLWIPTKLG